MLQEEPYFMKNEEWYTHDDKHNKYVLTDKAPEEARRSYEKFYNAYCYDAFDLGILKEVKQSMYDDAIAAGKTPEEAKKICDDWWKKITKA